MAVFDSVQTAVGSVGDLKGHIQLQRPDVGIRDPKTNAVTKVVKSDTPDLIIATGVLPSSTTVQEGANFLTRFRRGQVFPGDPALEWTVNGEKGEIRLVATASPAIQALAADGPIVIEVHDHASDTVEKIEWDWLSWQNDLPINARNIGALYEAFADGEEINYPSFADALGLHEQLDQIINGWSA